MVNGITSFGVFKESQTSGDYIKNKKAKTTYCNPDVCRVNKVVGSQGALNLLRTANHLKYYSCRNNFNKRNLNVNMITKLDLENVCIINDPSGNCPTTIESQLVQGAKPPYLTYTVDPYGSLFGNNSCEINSWINRTVYNPPAPNISYIFVLLPTTDSLSNPDADNIFDVNTMEFSQEGTNFVSTRLAGLFNLSNSHFNWYGPLIDGGYSLRQIQNGTEYDFPPGLYTAELIKVELTLKHKSSFTTYFHIKTTAKVNIGNIPQGQVLTIGYMVVDTTTNKVIELWELADYSNV